RVDVLLNSTTRRDATGAIVGVVGVGQDITELKKSQAQVIHSSKLATLGEMATSVAHELNQPLNVIRLAAGNCRMRLESNAASEAYLENKLERIEEQTARAASIIDHMRMFGRKTLESATEIDIASTIRNALDLVGEQLRLSGIEVVLDLPEQSDVYALGHAIQMEQVILNLITNSRDAILQKNSDVKRISIKQEIEGDEVKIRISDTGGGIPEKVLARIFEPFFTTKEIGRGTGLGLSVSYGIVNDMKGSIETWNEENGACTLIRLPVNQVGYAI
ncbi:sensor histidine kinase, partial [Actibacterium pelagium]